MRRNRRIAPPAGPKRVRESNPALGAGDLRCSTLKKTLLEVAALEAAGKAAKEVGVGVAKLAVPPTGNSWIT